MTPVLTSVAQRDPFPERLQRFLLSRPASETAREVEVTPVAVYHWLHRRRSPVGRNRRVLERLVEAFERERGEGEVAPGAN